MAETVMKRTSSSLSLRDLPTIPGLDKANYPTGLSFRYGNAIELDEIIKPTATAPRITTASSSSAPPPGSIWDSKDASDMTKPTSHGTNPSHGGYNGKHKGVITYSASSRSATHGSCSDTEREAQHHEDTLGFGSWAGEPPVLPPQQLKKKTRRQKKYDVVIQQHHAPAPAPLRDEECDEEPGSSEVQGPKRKYLRLRQPKSRSPLYDPSHFPPSLDEEAGSPLRCKPRPLSRPRFIISILALLAITLTLVLAAWGICAVSKTHKHQLYFVKAILLGSVPLLCVFTAIVMVAWRRVLVEILLMALVEFAVGGMLLMQIGELMEHR